MMKFVMKGGMSDRLAKTRTDPYRSHAIPSSTETSNLCKVPGLLLTAPPAGCDRFSGTPPPPPLLRRQRRTFRRMSTQKRNATGLSVVPAIAKVAPCIQQHVLFAVSNEELNAQETTHQHRPTWGSKSGVPSQCFRFVSSSFHTQLRCGPVERP